MTFKIEHNLTHCDFLAACRNRLLPLLEAVKNLDSYDELITVTVNQLKALADALVAEAGMKWTEVGK
jgi:hypothetical protein